MLAYRNTSLHLGYSPAQLLMRRRLQTSVPTIHSLREPVVPDQFTVSQRDKKEKDKQKTSFDSRHGVTDLKPLSLGDNVWLPDQRSAGQVIGEHTPRSYNVETSTGVYRRNRRCIIPLPATDTSVEDNANTQSHRRANWGGTGAMASHFL